MIEIHEAFRYTLTKLPYDSQSKMSIGDARFSRVSHRIPHDGLERAISLLKRPGVVAEWGITMKSRIDASRYPLQSVGSAGEWLTIRNKKGSVFGTEPFLPDSDGTQFAVALAVFE